VGDASISSRLFVFQDASIGGTLYVRGSSILVGDASFASRVIVRGDVSMGSRLYVVGDVSMGSRLYVVGDASISSRLFVFQDVSITGGLYVARDISLGGNLFANRIGIAIGGNTPLAALDIGIGPSVTSSVLNTYFNSGFAANTTTHNTAVAITNNFSINARGSINVVGNILAGSTSVSSDERIKTNIIDINTTNAIQLLRRLEPKQFNYKDTVFQGSRTTYGFIAQEVEKVIDQAVSKTTKYIPNIYELCPVVQGNVIILQNTSTRNFVQTDNEVISLKLFDKNNTEILTTVENIIDDKRFNISKILDNEKVFVYGQEVKDFRVLNNDLIFTITTASLKKFDKDLEITKDEMQTMKDEIKSMKENIEDLKNIIMAQQKQIEKLEKRLS
jgi:hypothetical protein